MFQRVGITLRLLCLDDVRQQFHGLQQRTVLHPEVCHIRGALADAQSVGGQQGEVPEADVLVVCRILDDFETAAFRNLNLAEIGSVRIYLTDILAGAQVKSTLQGGNV